MKIGKLIGVGVGPGDPDLLTFKAIKILKTVPVICSPRSANSRPSLAFSIVQTFLKHRTDDYELIEPLFPMLEDEMVLNKSWDEAAALVGDRLEKGVDVAFITLGDPTLYSTFSYIAKKIKDKGFPLEIIPGVTSFTGCAATAGISLGEKDEIILLVPKVDERFNRLVEHADTVVIMKTSRHPEIMEEMIERDSRDKTVVSIQNCGMKDEKIFKGFLKNGSYLSTTIVKFKK